MDGCPRCELPFIRLVLMDMGIPTSNLLHSRVCKKSNGQSNTDAREREACWHVEECKGFRPNLTVGGREAR